MKKIIVCDVMFSLALVGQAAQIINDYDYWKDAPSPFYIFLFLQLLFLVLLFRLPLLVSSRGSEVFILFVVLGLMINTGLGLYWFLDYRNEKPDFLKKSYYI